jgi:4'-phosphopantetheinyl transferase
MNTLHETERLRVSRLTRYEDQLNSLISVILIKFLLHKHFNVMSVIQRTLYGRPFVEDMLWNGDFNISHSDRVVVCAMNPAGKIGVDVEQITTLDLTIVEHCLSEFELEQWKQPQRVQNS